MSGIMRTTVSPSISSSTRSTPWVDGCCGPMFRIMVRSCPGSSTGVGFRWAIFYLAIALHGVIFAQRVTLPILGHQNAAQIRMPSETNAEHVENFALEVVGARPHRSERFDGRISAVQANFQPNALFVRDGKQMVDDFESGLGGIPVHAREVGKE